MKITIIRDPREEQKKIWTLKDIKSGDLFEWTKKADETIVDDVCQSSLNPMMFYIDRLISLKDPEYDNSSRTIDEWIVELLNDGLIVRLPNGYKIELEQS